MWKWEDSGGGRKWGGRILLGGRSWTKRETFDPPLIRPSKPSFKDIQETSQQGSFSSIPSWNFQHIHCPTPIEPISEYEMLWSTKEGVKRVHFEIRNFSYISLGKCLLPLRKMCNHTSAKEKSKKSLRHQDEDGLEKCAAHLLREKFLLDFQPHRGGQVNVCSFF